MRLQGGIQLAYDPTSGFFGRVVHTASGEHDGLLVDAVHRALATQSLEGLAPFYAGVCSAAQTDRIVDLMTSFDALLTPFGVAHLSAAAPYASDGGGGGSGGSGGGGGQHAAASLSSSGWAGTLSLRPQWLIWKGLLDAGRGVLAFQIASAGLNTSKEEIERSYNVYPRFLRRTGVGVGRRIAPGANTPLLAWFAAYHQVGHLTVGFDCLVTAATWARDLSALTSATLVQSPFSSSLEAAVVATVLPADNYEVTWNGEQIPWRLLCDGALDITVTFPPDRQAPRTGVLSVAAVGQSGGTYGRGDAAVAGGGGSDRSNTVGAAPSWGSIRASSEDATPTAAGVGGVDFVPSEALAGSSTSNPPSPAHNQRPGPRRRRTASDSRGRADSSSTPRRANDAGVDRVASDPPATLWGSLLASNQGRGRR